jgi:hypothetical protein
LGKARGVHEPLYRIPWYVPQFLLPSLVPLISHTGTTDGGIRNRISALRVKQRTLYEQLGWQLPEGVANHSAKKSKKEKRGAGDEAEMQTPSKKPKANQVKRMRRRVWAWDSVEP